MKLISVLAALVLTVSAVAAAEAQKVVRAKVSEDFAPSVKISGTGILVGVVVGSLTGNADPRKLVVPSASDTSGKPLCFTAKTRDGQYLAEAQLPKQIVPPEDFVIAPEGDWKHLNDLQAYTFGDFATLVRVGEDCALNPKATVTPVRYPSSDPATLTVFVNSQRSLSATASLKWADGRSAVGTCVKADSTRIRSAAFDMVCSIALPGASQGAAELSVERRSRLGKAINSYPLAIPVVTAGH